MVRRVLIVGYGSIGKRHLKLAKSLLPDADIKVLRHKECSEIPENASGCITGIESAIAFKPNIAVICNPATLHINIALPLLKIGTHLLIEKPLAASMDGVNELISCARQNQRVIMIAYNLRYLKSLREFRRLINDNLIGEVFSVRCEIGQNLKLWRPTIDYRTSVSAKKELGGGVLFELSHEIDYLQWIFGDIEWVNAKLSQQSNLEIDVEDTAHLILGFTPMSDGRQLVASLNMDFIRYDVTRQCTAIGEKGTLRWNGVTDEVALFNREHNSWEEVFRNRHASDDSYIEEWEDFLECIHYRKTPMITVSDGMKVLKVIEAARCSDKLTEQVSVNY